MKKFNRDDGLFYTVVEEDTGFRISLVNDKGKELDGFTDTFTNIEDAETACKIIARVFNRVVAHSFYIE